MKEKLTEVKCVKCGAVMRYGFLAEKESPAEFGPAMGFGFYWKPAESGLKAFNTVALIAYACPECGYIEPYVRNIQQDREKILLADTVKRN